jgi:hypothetical protein
MTVIVHKAVFPLEAVAVIIADPSDSAVITPLSTLAASGLLLVHVTALSVALPGVREAVNVSRLIDGNGDGNNTFKSSEL